MSLDPNLLDWSPEGEPRSRLYGDVYFSAEDGLSESRAVFLEGCDLPHAWTDRRQFVVGELGFGTGLNILALLDLWRSERPAHCHLSIMSVEGHLMSRDEATAAVERMIAGEIDILIGTQMAAKGHHFPNLTLVAVIDADRFAQTIKRRYLAAFIS